MSVDRGIMMMIGDCSVTGPTAGGAAVGPATQMLYHQR